MIKLFHLHCSPQVFISSLVFCEKSLAMSTEEKKSEEPKGVQVTPEAPAADFQAAGAQVGEKQKKVNIISRVGPCSHVHGFCVSCVV